MRPPLHQLRLPPRWGLSVVTSCAEASVVEAVSLVIGVGFPTWLPAQPGKPRAQPASRALMKLQLDDLQLLPQSRMPPVRPLSYQHQLLTLPRRLLRRQPLRLRRGHCHFLARCARANRATLSRGRARCVQSLTRRGLVHALCVTRRASRRPKRLQPRHRRTDLQEQCSTRPLSLLPTCAPATAGMHACRAASFAARAQPCARAPTSTLTTYSRRTQARAKAPVARRSQRFRRMATCSALSAASPAPH